MLVWLSELELSKQLNYAPCLCPYQTIKLEATSVSWSHFLTLLSVKHNNARNKTACKITWHKHLVFQHPLHCFAFCSTREGWTLQPQWAQRHQMQGPELCYRPVLPCHAGGGQPCLCWDITVQNGLGWICCQSYPFKKLMDDLKFPRLEQIQTNYSVKCICHGMGFFNF